MAAWQEGRATVPPPLVTILRALVLKPPLSIAAMAATVHQVNTEEQGSPRIEFVPGIWALPLRTRTLPPASCTNVWMPGGNRFVVIDPGSEDTAEIKAKTEALTAASHTLAQAVYERVQAQQTAAPGNGAADEEEVVEDAEYEVVDDEAKTP